MKQADRCFIVVKALPHRSSRYFETVCCAGVGADGLWRRRYPVPYRILDPTQKFRRWSWISYEFVKPGHDRRRESQKVLPESIKLDGSLRRAERSRILCPLIRSSFGEADARGDSLALLRPTKLRFSWERKTATELDREREKHAELANQLSWLDEPARPLEPPPYRFWVTWRDSERKPRKHESDDWESAGAFFNFRREYGEEQALSLLRQKFEEEYFTAGLALAFSTHSRRNVTNGIPNQWLLVGIIRLDETPQPDLFLGQEHRNTEGLHQGS